MATKARRMHQRDDRVSQVPQIATVIAGECGPGRTGFSPAGGAASDSGAAAYIAPDGESGGADQEHDGVASELT
jgi:hypothetical protein